MQLQTATPAEIDTILSELYLAEMKAEDTAKARIDDLHRALGERGEYRGRTVTRLIWPTTTGRAIEAATARTDEVVPRRSPNRTFGEVLARYQAAVDALAAINAQQDTHEAERTRRGGWTRFFVVQGGHIHSSQHCSTCNRGINRTKFGWLPDMSGMDETEALTTLAEQQHVLCTVCFPNAPIVAVAPVAPTHCAGSGQRPTKGTSNRIGMTTYGDCPTCTDRPLVTTTGVLRKHKAKGPRPVAAPAAVEPAPAAPAPLVAQPEQQHAQADAPTAPAAQEPAPAAEPAPADVAPAADAHLVAPDALTDADLAALAATAIEVTDDYLTARREALVDMTASLAVTTSGTVHLAFAWQRGLINCSTTAAVVATQGTIAGEGLEATLAGLVAAGVAPHRLCKNCFMLRTRAAYAAVLERFKTTAGQPDELVELIAEHDIAHGALRAAFRTADHDAVSALAAELASWRELIMQWWATPAGIAYDATWRAAHAAPPAAAAAH